ncbi:hypothetical protein [Terrabacter sp. BE26]|uniref:hypothetical protein n=1 Tax=Terrabacter sp. BE26 TaxID=2898152 RepID=UPI0035BE4127
MSRLHEVGHPAVTIPGSLALPLPSGDPHSLILSAATLERAFARATSTTTVRGTLGGRLDAVWTGEAAAAARAEADELGRRSRRVADALAATARSLRAYAAALETSIARVHSLQGQWDALDADRALASLRASAVPDPSGTVCALAVERARVEQVLGRARLSRAHEHVLDELRAAARRCAHVVAGVTEVTVPGSDSVTPAQVRSAVTGGLWFADGVVSARESRDAALSDSVLVRRAVAASAASHAPVADAAVGQLAGRLEARADDPVYAQALLSELGADVLAQLLMAAGVTQSRSGAHLDTVRELLAGMGSLVLTATSPSAPTGTDPRTRRRLASGAALLSDDLVDAIATVHEGPGDGRATGAWLLGQLLSGARAAGDDRRLPPTRGAAGSRRGGHGRGLGDPRHGPAAPSRDDPAGGRRRRVRLLVRRRIPDGRRRPRAPGRRRRRPRRTGRTARGAAPGRAGSRRRARQLPWRPADPRGAPRASLGDPGGDRHRLTSCSAARERSRPRAAAAERL